MKKLILAVIAVAVVTTAACSGQFNSENTGVNLLYPKKQGKIKI